ncbi:MAG: hypothetical protein R2778_16800 [Saprospiraceae bacterium]
MLGMMKSALTLILITMSTLALGQQLQFNEQLVDTIFIRSDRNAYQFDDAGTTKGTAEIVSITFDRIENQYIIDQFYRDEYIETIRPDTIKHEAKVHKSKIRKKLDLKRIESLLTSLSPKENNLDLFTQIDTTKLESLLTEKQIRKIAKWYEVDWYFQKKYSSRKQNIEFFKGCKSIDTLKIYLSERFDTAGYVMVTDYSNTINICISTNEAEYRFEGKYPNPIRQPWYNHSDTSQSFGQGMLNLMINQSLYELLPKNFLLKETISYEALVNDYITWYLGRREMKL